MQPLSVVLLQGDSRIAQSLTKSLCSSFRSVHSVRSLNELRHSIMKHHSRVVVLDIEANSLADVTELAREFPEISIVCTHRLADEEMWAAALSAGAADICTALDPRAVLASALRSLPVAQNYAA